MEGFAVAQFAHLAPDVGRYAVRVLVYEVVLPRF
jgi:hypothetical protein